MRLFLLFLLFPALLQAETFEWFRSQIDRHEMVQMLESRAKATGEMGKMQGSWGDPVFKIAANNYPKDSLKNNETPMTGVQYSVLQKISLSTKYGNIEKSYEALAQSVQMEKEQRKRLMRAELWKQAITLRKIDRDIVVLKENLEWVESMITVSKKLYSNGKLAQQGLLEIQIRKTNIETKILEIEYMKKEVESLLGYLAGVGENKTLDLNSVPWKHLQEKLAGETDFEEKRLEKELEASELGLKSSKQNYIPDVTIGLAYTKRSNIDNKGDFVGASVSFPLPFSGAKYSNHSNAAQIKLTKERAWRNYKLQKKSKLSELEFKGQKIEQELSILNKKTLNFAKSARDVTSRSYRIGNASYIELLNAELNLQNYLLKQTELESKLDGIKVEKALLSGGQI